MNAIARVFTILATGTSLVACSGGAQFTGLHEKILLAGPAKEAVAQAQTSAIPGDAYNESLRAAYLEYAEFELDEMNDYGDAIFHAKRASQAANGEAVEPQALSERTLDGEIAGELGQARESLVTALNNGGRSLAPMPAAQAAASYDCWIEQAEEALQPGHIAACKTTFEQAMAELTNVIATQSAAEKQGRANPELPDVITLDSDILFGFDSAKIEPAAADDLVEVAQLIKSNPGVALTIKGHTDNVGSDAYNTSLSERRANAVLTFMVNQDANPDRFTVEALGESQPIASNDTKEGRAQNRRVEIHSN